MSKKEIVRHKDIESRIFLLRGQRVMLDTDLAVLYGVKTKYINQQVNRNIGRFPERFMFRLSVGEKDELVANCNRFASLKHSVVKGERGRSFLIDDLSSRQTAGPRITGAILLGLAKWYILQGTNS